MCTKSTSSLDTDDDKMNSRITFKHIQAIIFHIEHIYSMYVCMYKIPQGCTHLRCADKNILGTKGCVSIQLSNTI